MTIMTTQNISNRAGLPENPKVSNAGHRITYIVLVQTLNHAQSINQSPNAHVWYNPQGQGLHVS